MGISTQRVKLDIGKQASMQVIRLGQGDKNGTTLVAELYDGGSPYSLSGKTARFTMRTPDGRSSYSVNSSSTSNNTATFNIDERYAAGVAGVTDVAYIEVLSGSTVICSTSRMRVICLQSATEGVSPSQMHDNGLDAAIAAANTAASSANTAASNANTKASRAETATTNANTARDNANTAASAANTAASAATTAAGSATTAAEAANSAKDAANAAATAANTAADSANAATSEANAAIEAMGDISELAVPEMTANVRGGAKVGGSTQVVGGKLEVKLSESATGTSVTTGSTSALRELQVHGKSVQNGTPTPDAPVEVQVVEGANLLPVTTQTRTMNGVTARVNVDGSISLSGTSTAEGDVYIYGGWQASSVDFDYIAGSSYTLSITPIMSGVVAKVYTFTSEGTLIGGSTTNPATGFITIRAAENAKRIGFSIRVASGVNVDGVTVRVQFERGSTPTPYVPYGYMGVKVVYDTKRIRGWAGNDGILHFGNSESMAARVYKGQAITVYSTGNRYFISLFSDEPTTEQQKSLWTIAPYGTSAQTEPRTYTVEINHDGWLFAYINSAESSTVRDGSSFFAMREIDLQGNVLASLPDGTRDELHVDSAGRVWIEKRVGKYTFNGSEDWSLSGGSKRINNNNLRALTRKAPDNYTIVSTMCNRFTPQTASQTYSGTVGVSIDTTGSVGFANGSTIDVNAWKTWLESNNIVLLYPIATPQTIELGYITTPAIPSGSVVTVSASLTPTFDLACWTEHASELADIPDAITTLAEVIYDKQESIASSIAPVEGSTASANHAVDDYLMLGARLYRVTTAIASGERIIPGTNVTETTVMAEIVSLLS